MADQYKEQNAEYFFNLAERYTQQRQIDKAIEAYHAAIEIDHNFVNAHHGLGVVFEMNHSFTEAEKHYLIVTQLAPMAPEPYNNLGNIYLARNQLEEAKGYYSKAINLNPNFQLAYYNMGKIEAILGNETKAIEYYYKSLAINPSHARTLNNLGSLYFCQGELDKSLELFEKAVKINPNSDNCLYNLGNAYRELGQTQKAKRCYEQALNINPMHGAALSQLYFLLRMTCAWDKASQVEQQLESLVQKGLILDHSIEEPPFVNIIRCDDVAQNYEVAKNICEQINRKYKAISKQYQFTQQEKSKIRVGYLSNDFYDHPTMHLMRKLFKCHDQERFEIYIYSYGSQDDSHYLQELRQDCNQFTDIRQLTFEQAADKIYQDKIDILIDLKGHTKGNRLEILSFKPAPIQVSYLGYPGTTGADFIDYMITDRIVTPDETTSYYSEKLVYLPGCYQVNDNSQEIAQSKMNRAELELPDNAFVFCSFNQSYKFDRIMFKVWMDILKQVPNSVLWLLQDIPDASDNLRREAQLYQVAADRLIFAPKLNKAEHLARMQAADLALDTRIYNGHTTTSDALWAGVPVIALQGKHFASRVSASILTALGLTECITQTLEAYQQRCIELGNSPEKVKSIHEKIQSTRLTSDLYNTEKFTLSLELAYDGMWHHYLQQPNLN